MGVKISETWPREKRTKTFTEHPREMGGYPHIFYIFTILFNNIDSSKNIPSYHLIQVDDGDVKGEWSQF